MRDISDILTDEKLLEKLAELEHKQWQHWTTYLLDNLTEENISRWRRQTQTDYERLSEQEKESDRDWARKTLMWVCIAFFNEWTKGGS